MLRVRGSVDGSSFQDGGRISVRQWQTMQHRGYIYAGCSVHGEIELGFLGYLGVRTRSFAARRQRRRRKKAVVLLRYRVRGVVLPSGNRPGTRQVVPVGRKEPMNLLPLCKSR